LYKCESIEQRRPRATVAARQRGRIKPLRVSMPLELKSSPRASPTHPGNLMLCVDRQSYTQKARAAPHGRGAVRAWCGRDVARARRGTGAAPHGRGAARAWPRRCVCPPRGRVRPPRRRARPPHRRFFFHLKISWGHIFPEVFDPFSSHWPWPPKLQRRAICFGPQFLAPGQRQANRRRLAPFAPAGGWHELFCEVRGTLKVAGSILARCTSSRKANFF
jgi:hypothetical protein